MPRRLEIIEGDCVEAMAAMEAESIDAVVCDPPYGIGFMGKEFDTFKPEEIVRQKKRDTHSTIRRGVHQGKQNESPSAAMAAGRYDFRAAANREFQEWTRLWAIEALRVLKPGGWAAVFGGTRTYHRMICGLEDAGFEIRDCCAWIYGSGFPKSLDISAAIDAGACRAELEKRLGRAPTREEFKAAWKTFRKVLGVHPSPAGSAGDVMQTRLRPECDLTTPATEAAKEWEGWGTALKPAWEPICLARKPFKETVAENVLRYGTGGLNIDACRIGTDDTRCNKIGGGGKTFHGQMEQPRISGSENGRWPANLVLDEEAAEMLDAQSGESKSTGESGLASQQPVYSGDTVGAYLNGVRAHMGGLGDTGGASRFFYCAKTSAWEREAGLEDLEPRKRLRRPDGDEQDHETPGRRTNARRNHHPTVKPVSLMRWLVRLITPRAGGANPHPDPLPEGEGERHPGPLRGLVLDPFAGSGTTGMACALEIFDFIGCEKEAEYAEIARRRIEYARANPRAFDVGTVHAKAEKAVAGQRELF